MVRMFLAINTDPSTLVSDFCLALQVNPVTNCRPKELKNLRVAVAGEYGASRGIIQYFEPGTGGSTIVAEPRNTAVSEGRANLAAMLAP